MLHRSLQKLRWLVFDLHQFFAYGVICLDGPGSLLSSSDAILIATRIGN
jgi:hypothetical protein